VLLSACFLVLTALFATVIHVTVRSRIRTTSAYLCGEDEDEFRRSLSPSGTSMYWGATEVLRRYLRILRDEIHTGFLDDWFSLMVPFMALLIVAAIVASVVLAGV